MPTINTEYTIMYIYSPLLSATFILRVILCFIRVLAHMVVPIAQIRMERLSRRKLV